MTQAVLPRQRSLVRAVLVGALALLCGSLLAGPARAAVTPAEVACSGHVNRGVDPTLPDQLDALFACSADIKAFSIVSSAPLGGFEVTADVFAHGTTDIIEGDSFNCEGLIPGDGFSCFGQALVGHDVHAAFEANDPLCVPGGPRRPRIWLIVSDVNGATSGPFRLRGPEPCVPAKPPVRRHGRKHHRKPAHG